MSCTKAAARGAPMWVGLGRDKLAPQKTGRAPPPGRRQCDRTRKARLGQCRVRKAAAARSRGGPWGGIAAVHRPAPRAAALDSGVVVGIVRGGR
jgi:hypothetical protein